jgi:hypothetical protein
LKSGGNNEKEREIRYKTGIGNWKDIKGKENN